MSLSYLRNLNGYYYLRTRIPCDLLHYFNYPEIQKSLKTKKLSVAKAHSKVLASNAELLFAQIRSGLLEDQQIYQLTEKYFPSRKNNLKYTVKPRMLSQVIAAYVEEHIAMDKWQEKTRREVTSSLKIGQAKSKDFGQNSLVQKETPRLCRGTQNV